MNYDTKLNNLKGVQMTYETEYSSSFVTGVEDGTRPLRNITLLALLQECGVLSNIPQSEINKIKWITISWTNHSNEGDIDIYEISNTETGEVYWEYNDLPQNRSWTESDEKLVSSILMWCDVESSLRWNI